MLVSNGFTYRNADEPHRMRQLVKVPYNKPPPRQRMYISRDGVVRDSIVDGSVPTRNPAPEGNKKYLCRTFFTCSILLVNLINIFINASDLTLVSA